MAQPAVTSYAPASVGAPIYAGSWPGGRLRGDLQIGSITASGALGQQVSGLSGSLALDPVAVTGGLTGYITWGAGSEVGSLSAGTWTPGRNASGEVTQASINALPLNQWVKVSGATLQALKTLIEAGGFSFNTHEWSVGHSIASAFQAWVGCADDGRRIYYPRGGGHADSSLNAVLALDVMKLGWEVTKAPSRPDAPGFVWNASYDVPPNSTFTGYTAALPTDDGLYRDILPDGTPTSAHTYNGVWFDSTRNQIGTGRVSRWVYNLTTNTWSRSRWTYDGSGPTAFTINQQFHYHAGRDAIYGFPGRSDSDYYSFGKCPAVSAAWSGLSGPSNYASTAISSVRLTADRVAFFWYHNSAERWGIYNMATESWESGSGGAITGGKALTYLSEMMPAVYVPTWGTQGQIIRRGTADGLLGQWWVFDIASKANVTYTPAGSPPGTPIWSGNKYRAMPNLGVVIALDDSAAITSPAIHLMRYA